MSRLEEIDKFLKHFAKVYAQNPNFSIFADSFYSDLMNYGLTPAEVADQNMRYNFEKWTDRYLKSDHMFVYHDLRQTKFLQFRSRRHSDTFGYKLYLSFPKEKMEECVNEVMDFVEKNKMDSHSKVSEKVRSDSIVLRLAKADDALKLVSFVNSNPRLTQVAKPTNPFVMRAGVMGFAYDDMLSYNSIVTMLLESYFTEKRKTNALATVSQDDFAKYARKYHSELFTDPKKLRSFTQKRDFNNRHDSLGHAITNYEQVFRLIAFSVSGDFTFEQYRNFVEASTNKKYTDEYAKYYQEFVHSESKVQQYGYGSIPQNNVESQSVNINTKKALFDEYVTVALRKYGPNGMIPYIERYMNGGVQAITRENDLRSKFVESRITRKDIMSICGGNLETYIANFQNQQSLSTEKYNLAYKTFVETFKKYGYAQLYGAIERGVLGNYGAFTNGPEKLREKLCASVTPAEIVDICKEIARRQGLNPDSVQNGYLYAADAIQMQFANTQQIANSNQMMI